MLSATLSSTLTTSSCSRACSGWGLWTRSVNLWTSTSCGGDGMNFGSPTKHATSGGKCSTGSLRLDRAHILAMLRADPAVVTPFHVRIMRTVGAAERVYLPRHNIGLLHH